MTLSLRFKDVCPVWKTMVVAFLSLLGTGCGFNRRIIHEDRPILIDDGVAFDRTVVSGFYQADHGVSVTNNSTIRTITETASLKEITRDIAVALRERGLQAEAKSDQRIDTTKGTLLVRGTLTRGGEGVIYDMGGLAAGIILTSLTIGVIGILLPYPFSVETKCPAHKIRIEMVDDSGSLVASYEDELAAQYSSVYFTGAPVGCSRDRDLNLKEFFNGTMDRLATALKSRRRGK